MTLFDSSLPDSVVLEACDKAQIGDWVKERGLDYEIDNALSSLSGGEKQRILLARFFAHRARFGVLDEITAGLDMKTVAQVEIRMADELDGFVYVSHRLDSGIMQLVDQVIVVDGMRVVDLCTTCVIPGHVPVVVGGVGGALKKWDSLWSLLPASDRRPAGAFSRACRGWRLTCF